MNSLKATIALFFLCSTLHAQNLQWVKGLGSSGAGGSAIAVDGSGNIYTAGRFSDTITFNYGTSVSTAISHGNADIFITKHDASGNLIWAKTIGGSGLDAASSIAPDYLGNVYVAGYFADTVDFDPDPSATNIHTSVWGADAFIMKLNSAGQFQWAKTINGTSAENVNGIAIDKAGNVVAMGAFTDSVDFDPGPGVYKLGVNQNGGRSTFILKLNTAGNFIWAKSFGVPSVFYDGVVGSSIALDATGNVLTTGYFSGPIDFDPGAGIQMLSPVSSMDVFISKLDRNGNFVWAKSIGGTTQQSATGIATDASGNVYTTGYFRGTTDFDPGTDSFKKTAAGGQDIFISSLDSNGAFRWATGIGGSGYDLGNGIYADDSGVYTTGYFKGSTDFDPGAGVHNLVSSDTTDQFILRLTTAGNYVWAGNTTGSNSFSDGMAITADGSGNIYTTGFFTGTTDFDANSGTHTLSSGSSSAQEAFILKLGPGTTGVQVVNNRADISIMPNPTTGVIRVVADEPLKDAVFSIVNAAGQLVQRLVGISGNQFTVDISVEAAGVYFLRVEDADRVVTVKVVKQ